MGQGVGQDGINQERTQVKPTPGREDLMKETAGRTAIGRRFIRGRFNRCKIAIPGQSVVNASKVPIMPQI